MTADLRLVGKKTVIRPFRSADITPAYLDWLNDPDVTRFSNQRFVHHTREGCERYLASFADGPNLFLAILDRTDERAIGTMTAYMQPHHGTVDMGILVGDPGTWGRGYGSDAWHTLTTWLLGRADVRKVTAGTLACNRAMLRLIETSGLAFEGARIGQELIDGEPCDILYFGRFAVRPSPSP